MARKRKRFRPAGSREDELSKEELEAEAGEELPDREAMSAIDANVAIPVNPAVAASVLAGGSPDDLEGEDSPPSKEAQRP